MDYKVKLKNINSSAEIVKINDNSKGLVLANILENFSKQDLIIIAENFNELELLEAQIKFFNPKIEEKFEILQFLAWDCLPYDRASPKSLISSSRVRVLHKIANKPSGKNFIIITTSNALIQKVISKKELKNYGLCIKPKSKIQVKEICDFLVMNGYNRFNNANSAGEFAVRGGIVDFVTEKAADLIGYRIDFFGDEIESIKSFDPLTQITHESLREIEILPASEVVLNDKTVENFRQKYRKIFGASLDDELYEAVCQKRSYLGIENWLPIFYEEKLVSVIDYFEKPVLFFNNKIENLAVKRWELIKQYYEARVEDKKINKNLANYNALEPENLYFNDKEFKENLDKNTKITFNNFDSVNLNQRIFDLEIKAVPDFFLAGKTNQTNPFDLFKKHFSFDKRIIITCFSDIERSQINRILSDQEINSVLIDDFEKILKLPKKIVALVNLPLNHGFETSDFIFVSQHDLLGEKITRKKTSNKNAAQRILEEGLSIQLGELVVHRNYGIGKFEGIQTIEASGVKNDMIKILYGGGDVLFVAVDEINLISRYGADNPLIQLDRLGVAAWKNRRQKVKEKIKIAAEELLKIAAARSLKKAPILVANQHFYDEFKARFGFVETEDQANAILEVEEDLSRGSPMDRLICGDVGFGKTEVALRAAAIAIKGSNIKTQVAIVAPTTLLCRQHYKNFIKRFEGFDIKIAQLSRLTTQAKNKETKEKLEKGEIDIIIGTHALLQKNVKFKNLVLVIIDEEQHFGVAQKERLKEFRNEVHILTLSATPIPRTLQMSLSGVKDLSLIATAPIDRIAIRNFVMPFDSVIVREAVLREYNRSGRVFFVVPRVSDIDRIEQKLKTLLPEIKITSAHGRMTPAQLDEIMNNFVDGKIDLLISTTIIESGIDIEQANTMIIYKAHMFGLSQLYQLRGRVGRGKNRAYAYFMLDEKNKVSPDAQKKLEVMQNIDSLGVGFSIASHDMDIRGSGNLLGGEQSGHVRETGVELYQQMLLETINSIKSGILKSEKEIQEGDFSTSIKLGISLLIPEEYMPDLALRMSFYKKIATIRSEEEQDALEFELKDRFGKVPLEVINLMKIARLKQICKKLDIERIEAINDGILIAFKDNKFKNPDKLLEMIFSSQNKIKIYSGQKVLFNFDNNNMENKIVAAFKAVRKIGDLL